MGKWTFPVIVVAVGAVLVGVFVLGNRQAPKPSDQSAGELLGTKHEDQGQEHIPDGQKVTAYNSNLPSSGQHYGKPTEWGIKDGEIEDERLVHNMEHGGIVITYLPDLEPGEIDELKKIFSDFPLSTNFNSVKAVLAPRSANTHRIQLAAWTYTLDLDSPDKDQIRKFYTDHLDKGPELVP